MMMPDIVKAQPFLDSCRVSGYAYYQLPKAMLSYGPKLGLTTDSTLLYTVLRERTKLSLRNGKIEPDGRIYVYYPRSDAAKYLGWSLRKTVGVFSSLVDSGLLVESPEFSKTGRQLAMKLFVKRWQNPTLEVPLEDISQKKFRYITEDNFFEADLGEYYILPKLLIESEVYTGLSLRSILLYMVILDRLSLSVKYGRIDGNGLVWTTLDSEITQRELSLSARTLVRCYGELEDIGLIERRQTTYGEKWRIYARDFLPPPQDPQALPEPDPPEAEGKMAKGPPVELRRQNCTPETPNLHPQDANFTPQEAPKTHPPEMPNLHPIKPSLSNPSEGNLSQEENIPAPADAGLDVGMPDSEKKKQLNGNLSEERIDAKIKAFDLTHYNDVVDLVYDLVADEDRQERLVNILDMLVPILEQDLLDKRPYTTIGKESILREKIIASYESLDPYIIYLLIEKVEEHQEEIKDKTAYLHRALYAAPAQHKGSAYHLKRQIEKRRYGGL